MRLNARVENTYALRSNGSTVSGDKPPKGGMKLRRGRRAPTWTDVPDFVTWLVDCPVARELYRLLKMHVNVDRDDDLCWPTLSSLASLLNLSREDKVNPYLQKLVDARLVDKSREGMPARNVYVIHDLPPGDWAGPMSLADWYRIRKATGEGVIPARPRRGKAAKVDKTTTDAPVPPKSGVQEPTPPVPPISGVQVPTDRGVLVPPKSGVEQELLEGVLPEVNKAEDQQPPPPFPGKPPATSAGRTNPAEEEGSKSDQDQILRDTALEILDRAQNAGRSPRRVHGPQVAELRDLAVAALLAGWQPDDLVDAIGGELVTAASVFGALRFRLKPENLGPPPVRPGPPPQRRPCSYGCVSTVIVVGDRGLACPDCKPDRHAAQRRRLASDRSVPMDEVTFDHLCEAAMACG